MGRSEYHKAFSIHVKKVKDVEGVMEALVVASAAVVGIYGYRTAMEIVRDIENDGSWELVCDTLRDALHAVARLRLRLSHLLAAEMMHWQPAAYRRRHHRTFLIKPHA